MNSSTRTALRPTPAPTAAPRALVGEIIPVGDLALESSLINFDRLFDARDPLGARSGDGWTLTPYIPPARRGGAVAMEARRLLAEGAHVLRLSYAGEDVAVAAVRTQTPAEHPAPALRLVA